MTNIYTSIGITCIILSTIVFIVYYNSSVTVLSDDDKDDKDVKDVNYLTIAIGFLAIGVSLLMIGIKPSNRSPVERERLTPVSGDVGDPYDSIFDV
uniref:Uncharacterized protein n=1 Tax=viral metagenome TaxID=1070528 RepID=A0A6C0LVT9_9ZZZZ